MGSEKFYIAGLETHIYGLDEVRKSKPTSVDVVFILHGRTRTYSDSEPFALAILDADKTAGTRVLERGLIVVSFDQRNHGHRVVSELGNWGWAEGNQTHAQDMFSIYYGTSQDVSLLITFLPSFLFPQGECKFANIICTGISLGGHSTYLVLSNDKRVGAGVVVIGCPEYETLMADRAGEKDRETRLPRPFLDLVAELGPDINVLSTKDLLILKGDIDPLVPWAASEKFVAQLPLEKAEVVGFPGVGHAFPDEMKIKGSRWIADWRRSR